MLTLQIPDMSCGHCKKTIESAINAIDASATLVFDMDEKTVRIESQVSDDEVIRAVGEAGYTASDV